MNYIELLKKKCGIVIDDKNIAKEIFDLYEFKEKTTSNKNCYRYNKNGEITAFYPAIYYERNIKNDYIIIAFGDDESTMLKYDEDRGIYVSMNNIIDNILNKTMAKDDPSITRHRKNVKDEIFRRCRKIEPIEINKNEYLLNFKNGLYDLKTKKMLKHSSDIISTIQINGEYKENAIDRYNGSLFEKYLNTTFDKEIIPVIQETFGYCISAFTEAQKMFLLEGTGGNGKSTFEELVAGLFFQSDTTNVSLEQTGKQEYLFELATSAFNSCGDIDNSYIKNPGVIKQLTGGTKNERIMARTLFGKPISFKPACKFMFSANMLPNSSDKNTSWYDRLVIVPFYKTFRNTDKEIKNIAQLILKEEIDIVISWAIEGLNRLLNNKFKFTESKIINKKLQEYRFQNDNFSCFVNNYCIIDKRLNNEKEYSKAEKDEKYFIPNVELMKYYQIFCQENNEKMLGKLNIVNFLRTNKVHEKSKTLFNKRYYEGIAWNEQITELSENDYLNGKIIDSEKNETTDEINENDLPIDNNKIISQNENIVKFKSKETFNVGNKMTGKAMTVKISLQEDNPNEILEMVFLNEDLVIFIPKFENNQVYQQAIKNLLDPKTKKPLYIVGEKWNPLKARNYRMKLED